MPRFITPPDFEYDASIPKVMIINIPWTHEDIINILGQLSDKPYDIYLYNPAMNDIQWYEGLRHMCTKVLNFNHFKDRDPIEWLSELDDEF
jgi:hypothetical protein